MIRLTRVRTPEAIVASFHGPGRIALETELIARRQAQQEPRSAVWKTAKPQLKLESGGKCGYCEGKAAHVAHGDVEHFRPKSVYWWLAYCYENYVFACQICNQSFKGSSFPVAGPAWPEPASPAAGSLGPDPLVPGTISGFQAMARAERAGIPDPYLLDPERLFVWRADDVLREVELLPRPRARGARAAHAAATQFLGLNREELRKWRYEIYEIATVLADAIELIADPAIKARSEATLRRMMGIGGEFAGMVRYFVRELRGLAL